MSQGILPRACFILVISAFLSACGGGSSDLIGAGADDSETDPSTGTGAESFTITVGLDTNGDVTDAGESAINADTPGVLFATVLQSDGSPAVGTIVGFTLQTTVGEIFPSSGTALTDSTGVASVALTAGTVPGANTAVAAVIDNVRI